MDLTKNIVILAGVYADQFDVQIKINSQGQASTSPDGKTIWIPKPKPDYESMTWGFCAHEAGHVRDTDTELISKTKKGNPFLGWMLNLIEDTRIEHLQIGYFPGVKKHFNTLSEQVLKYNWEESKDKSLSELLIEYVFYYIRGFITNYPIWDDDTKELQNTLNSRYNLLFMYSFNQLLDKARYVGTTKEALELSKEVVKYLDNAAQDNTQDSSTDGEGEDPVDDTQQKKDCSDHDSSGNQSCSEDSTQQQGNEPSCGDESDDNSLFDVQDSESLENSGANSNGTKPLTDEAKEALKEALTKTTESLGSGDLGETLKEILSDSNNQERLTNEERYALGEVKEKMINISQAQIDSAVQISAQTTSQLRNGLVRLIEDQTRSQRVTARKGRRIAKSKCSRLLVGNTRIFKRKFSERDEINCDVAVLADYSGSIGHDIKSVQTATYSLLDCLSRIEGAKTCAYGFGGDGIVEIQKPNQRMDQLVKGRIFSLKSNGGTPATEAYWSSIRALNRMSGLKKVVIMITDGEPNDQTATYNIVEAMKKQGVSIIAVGVCVSPRAHSIFDDIYGAKKWMHVRDFNDFPGN